MILPRSHPPQRELRHDTGYTAVEIAQSRYIIAGVLAKVGDQGRYHKAGDNRRSVYILYFGSIKTLATISQLISLLDFRNSMRAEFINAGVRRKGENH